MTKGPQIDMAVQPMIGICGISRSGTTLLSSILDAHTRITMCNELVVPSSLDLGKLYSCLRLERQSEYPSIKSVLKKNILAKHPLERKFLAYFYRTGISLNNLIEVLARYCSTSVGGGLEVGGRLSIAADIAQAVRGKEDTVYTGFKVPPSCTEEFLRLFAYSKLIFIFRDPRAVFLSLSKARGPLDIGTFCKGWSNAFKSYSKLYKYDESSVFLVNYEALVGSPNQIVESLLSFIGVDFELGALDFHLKETRAIKYGHNNKEKLSKGLFKDSVGLWRNELSEDISEKIADYCSDAMCSLGYY